MGESGKKSGMRIAESGRVAVDPAGWESAVAELWWNP